MLDLDALAGLMEVLANAASVGDLFRRRGKGVAMVPLREMSLERPPNPQFTPARTPKP